MTPDASRAWHRRRATRRGEAVGGACATHPARPRAARRSSATASACTLVLAVIATVGRIVVPIAVQQTLDRGINAPGGPDLAFVGRMVAVAALAVAGRPALASYCMTDRLFTAPSAAWRRCGSRRSGTSTTCRCSPRTPSAAARWSPG